MGVTLSARPTDLDPNGHDDDSFIFLRLQSILISILHDFLDVLLPVSDERPTISVAGSLESRSQLTCERVDWRDANIELS